IEYEETARGVKIYKKVTSFGVVGCTCPACELTEIKNQELIQELTARINSQRLTEQQMRVIQEEINEKLEEE
ncbi:22724_t:CDS:2, partial [Racocetra persica]